MKLPIWIRPMRLALAGAALLLLSAACAGYIQPPGMSVVWVSIGPPSARHEARSRAPGADFIWISGYHRWNGSRYEWTPGRWERRPQPRSVWVGGRWRHERRGWYFIEGHWQARG